MSSRVRRDSGVHEMTQRGKLIAWPTVQPV